MNIQGSLELMTNMRGEHFLAMDGPDGAVAGILPGGTFDPGPDHDATNLVINWRIARWNSIRDITDDLPPAEAKPISAQQAIEYAPGHAEWIVTRAARQLDIVSRFVHHETVPEETKILQQERTETVLDDLIEAVGLFKDISGKETPATVDESIVAACSIIGRSVH